MHNEIVRKFPYHQKLNTCHEGEFVPHEAGNQFLAEIPKAYFAYEDDLSIYDGIRIEKKLRENGYRSVHYILSYKGVYVELQTRTIYDEAWSDCDHSYVYKHDENKSHAALQVMSKILCEYTNASNDYGDLMKHIYDQSPIFDAGVAKFITSADVKDEIKKLLDRFSRAQIELKQLLDNIHVEEGGVSGV